MNVRLGAFATHPVQYQAPWFRGLAASPGVELTVYYGMLPDVRQQGSGFGVDFQWDLPLLEGYRHRLLKNRARRPSLDRFSGCSNPSIVGELRRARFDAFLVTGWGSLASVQALLACRLSRTPCMVRGESNSLRLRPFPIRLAHRMLLTQYQAFLAIGKSNEAFYLANGVPQSKIFPGRYCVENDRFQSQAEGLRHQRGVLRAAWGIPTDAFVFLFCGKLIPKKRPLDLIEALALARRTEPPSQQAHLLVVGDGALRSQCEASARSHGVPASFVGFLNQTGITAGYVVADCLVLPSDYGETWGLVVNEAMACGLPAVVSDRVGCHQDLVLPGQTGLVYPCRDIGALALALRALLDGREDAPAMGDRARRHIEAYSLGALVEGTLSAARFVTGRKRPAAPSLSSMPC